MRRRRDRFPERELLPRRRMLILRIWDRIRGRRPVVGNHGFGDPGFGPPDAGVREPLRPRPTAGAGAIALPTPDE